MPAAATTTTDETFVESTSRGTKNAFAGCFGFLKKSDEYAKIKYKETLIASRKKKFGVDYMNLLEQENAGDELAACVKLCQDDVKVLKDEIATLEAEIARVDEETRGKIVAKPGGSTSAEPNAAKLEEAKEDTTTTTPTAPSSPDAPSAPSAPAVTAAN